MYKGLKTLQCNPDNRLNMALTKFQTKTGRELNILSYTAYQLVQGGFYTHLISCFKEPNPLVKVNRTFKIVIEHFKNLFLLLTKLIKYVINHYNYFDKIVQLILISNKID